LKKKLKDKIFQYVIIYFSVRLFFFEIFSQNFFPKILEIAIKVLLLQSVSQKSGVFWVACLSSGGLFKRKAFFERFT